MCVAGCSARPPATAATPTTRSTRSASCCWSPAAASTPDATHRLDTALAAGDLYDETRCAWVSKELVRDAYAAAATTISRWQEPLLATPTPPGRPKARSKPSTARPTGCCAPPAGSATSTTSAPGSCSSVVAGCAGPALPVSPAARSRAHPVARPRPHGTPRAQAPTVGTQPPPCELR